MNDVSLTTGEGAVTSRRKAVRTLSLLLGLDANETFRQRVNNWKRRAIPPRVILDHYLVIERLRQKAQNAA